MKVLLVFVATTAGALEVSVSPGGSVVVRSGSLVLETVDVFLGNLSASGGGLRLEGGPRSESGEDVLGRFNKTTLEWNGMDTAVKAYADLVVFEQFFPERIVKPLNASSSLACTGFPLFRRPSSKCFAYHGVFPAMGTCDEATHQGGLPLVVYDTEGALVFSSLENHKAQHAATSKDWVGAGVKAGVDEIPQGWTQRFVVVEGKTPSMRDTFDAWGAALREWSGSSDKRRMANNAYRDVAHSGLGFWTDNGGYYHYYGPSDPSGKNNNGTPTATTYEEVLTSVKRSHDEAAIPFRHWQFDSWFYPKDSDVSAGGGGGAVTNWTAMPSVFPSGMAAMVSKNLGGMPMIMHNRQWSPVSDYVTQNQPPGMEWLASNGAAVPRDPFAFFDWFFQRQKGWNLYMYEQDWLNKEYDLVDALTTNLTLADDWLRGLAAGVEASGRTMQFCMPYPYDVLAAAALPAVTNARATNDYFHADGRNWAIGATALFYAALDVLPFKDGFYSSNRKQPGGQNEGPELHPDREILMASLSMAMVGPMDGEGFLNASRVTRSCRGDGILLKPDRPLVLSDACFARDDPATCDVFATFSKGGEEEKNTSFQVHYLYVDDPSTLDDDDDTLGDLLSPEFTDVPEALLFNFYTRDFRPVASDTVLAGEDKIAAPGYEGHTYLLAAPIVQGWAFIGEIDKYVPASTFRFKAIVPSPAFLDVTLVAAPGETVGPVCAVYGGDTLLCDSVTNADAAHDADLSLRLAALPAAALAASTTA
eukprot:CAMPEP_0118914238 /NCGR_PEP_ID=MMETSP1166-20130328/14663_1 /TAXON_ID=1104430 /ORGANISM="Chrysoreinhardia sp, Strain CCMP3193" /LENGTH=758 /DNA_ID=CAMNT_0006853807 /DNA_START=30 /DNA_END=2306 /DNA_ORIENTATION=-